MHSFMFAKISKANANAIWSSHLGECTTRISPPYGPKWKSHILPFPANLVRHEHSSTKLTWTEGNGYPFQQQSNNYLESTQTPNIWGKSAQPSETSPRSLSLPSAWRSDHQQDPEISGVTLHEEVKLITTGGLDPGISGSLETPSARKFDTIGRELQIAGF